MSGINSIKSKLKKLGAETEIKKLLRSVITFAEHDKIVESGVIPDDIREGGWLVVPGMSTIEEWGRKDSSQDIEYS